MIDQLVKMGQEYAPILARRKKEIETELERRGEPITLQIGRRGFLARLSRVASALYLLGAASFSLLATGCAVWDDIKAWIPIALEAVGAIVALIPGLSMLSPIITVITAGLSQILTDIQQYQNVAGPTLLSKIQAGLSDVVANLQNFLQSINVNDPALAAIITGLAQIILSTIAAFQQRLTAAGAPAPAVAAPRPPAVL